MKIERRKFMRYQVLDDTLYIFSEDSTVMGWVKDISIGGMAIRYCPVEDLKPKPEIRLILSGDKIPVYLPDIPCKTIYDIKVDENDRPFERSGTRHCGLQFGRLDTGMKEKLTDLLSSEVMLPEMKTPFTPGKP
jgi:c-di-GMP-binding flagellar brake protein YcgR